MQRAQFGVITVIAGITNRDRDQVSSNHCHLPPKVDLRRAAAAALRGMSDPSSARFLIQALDDPDRAVRYCSIMALVNLARP